MRAAAGKVPAVAAAGGPGAAGAAAAPPPAAAVIWLHGLGDSGRGWADLAGCVRRRGLSRVWPSHSSRLGEGLNGCLRLLRRPPQVP